MGQMRTSLGKQPNYDLYIVPVNMVTVCKLYEPLLIGCYPPEKCFVLVKTHIISSILNIE